MNRLSGMKFYLSGPIDDVDSASSRSWRDDMSSFLWSRNAGVLNPLDKPMNIGKESHKDVVFRREMKRSGDYEGLRDIMKDVCSCDMNLVDICNGFILYIDRDAHMCGSYIETAWASLEKKPVIICCKQGKEGVPDFLWGLCPHQMFFGDWQSTKEYLNFIDGAPYIEHLKRWRFINFNKVYNSEN